MKKFTLTPAQLKVTGRFPAWINIVMMSAACLILVSCGGETANQEAAQNKEAPVELAEDPNAPAEDNDLGVGPVKTVDVTNFDPKLAETGKKLFEAKCTACHRVTDQKLVGPGLKGVTERQKPEWIMNMIMNPGEMTHKDPEAKKLLAEHVTQMTDLKITKSEARALLEYLRQNDGAK